MVSTQFKKHLKRSALTVALGLCVASGVHAQSTTGSIYGTVPGDGNASIVISNNSGFSRTISADSTGRYNATTLPVGTYTVTIQRDGKVVGTRDVTVRAGAGTDVSFAGAGAGDATTMEAVTVTGANIPPIDISATDTRMVITAEQLERLPLNRSAEAIALLAPGAISGAAGFFGGLVSFGGAGVSENAYYVNGYFSGEPLSNLGGFSLPYGAVAQQETYTGGYSAKYGRSDGGVISQIGKRGTNDWEYGGQVVWVPRKLRAEQADEYLPNMQLPDGYEYENPDLAGSLYSRGGDTESWRSTYSAYVGGPILKDRLFGFVATEWYENDAITAPSALGTPRSTYEKTTRPKLYAKLDWNISDNHFLELSYLSEENERDGYFREYDLATGTTGAVLPGAPTPLRLNSEYVIAKYTGYLTDDLTFSATYGRAHFLNQQINPSILPGIPLLAGVTNQDPSITGGTPITNNQGGYQAKDARDRTHGLRADLEWIVGDHTLTLGMDNITFDAENEGTSQIADRWVYSRTANPNNNISSTLGVGAPGKNYYVSNYRRFDASSMSLDQKAWYIEDRWQVTDNLLLSAGIRNDQFTNANNFGEVYMDAKNQWAPRLGASWDVLGDSTLKVFANAGRYFLAMPNNVAIRGASASTFTNEYFTYTGIDANGAPTGLTPVPGVNGAPAPGPVSSNGELGGRVDVLAFAPSDLKNMYQDEYILGFEKSFGDNWMFGAKLTHRDLKSAIDDICDPYTMEAVLAERGIDPSTLVIPGCLMFNPGGTNTFSLAKADGTGRVDVTMSSADWRFEEGLKRTYDGLDLYLERPFDGTWEARVDYTYSKSKGNTEGQVKSEFGQSNISKTQDWDVAEMMRFSSGYLANDRRHQFKARGSYQVSPEWLLGANFRIQSGAPISCLGFFNPDGSIDESSAEGDPVGYGASYHTCFGQVATPGDKRNPWTRTFDLGVTYRPRFFNDKVSFGMQVLNVLNEREPLQADVTSETDPYTVSNTFLLPQGRQTPRYVVFSASVDF